MKNKILIFVLMLMCFCSCSTKQSYYNISIDSIIPNENIDFEKTYTLKHLGTDIEDLYYKEYCLYVKYALSKKGYVFKNDGNANLVIFIDYGNGQPKTFYRSYYIPIYGTTTYTSKSNLSGYSFETQTSTFGQTGAISGIDSYTKYSNYIVLYACDKNKLERDKEVDFLWQTNIYCVNDNGNLREHFPKMLNVSLPYIAEDTFEEIIVEKELNSKDNYRFIKNACRKQNEIIENFYSLKELKEYQEKSKDFFDNNKKLSRENIVDKNETYYLSDRNYEYFNDIDTMIKILNQKYGYNNKNDKLPSTWNNLPKSWKKKKGYVENENGQNIYKQKKLVEIRILEDYILQQIRQGAPVNKEIK